MPKFVSKLLDSAESIQARLDRSLKEACDAVTNGAKGKYGTDIAIKTKRLIRTQPTEDWSFIAVIDFVLAPKITKTERPGSGEALQAEGRLAVPRQGISGSLLDSLKFDRANYEIEFFSSDNRLLEKGIICSRAQFMEVAERAQSKAPVAYVEVRGWNRVSFDEKAEHFDASEVASKIEREFHKEATTSFKLAGANVLSVDVSAQHNVAQVKASIRLKPAARPIRTETVTRTVR